MLSRPVTFKILSERDSIAPAVLHISNMQPPFTVTVKKGKPRSLDQNALAWKWAGEISAWRGDITPNQAHAYNKLHFGVPIRRETDDDFAEKYDRIIKPLPYEAKLALMQPPIDLPVTRDFKAAEMTRFMDDVLAHWTGQGAVLTDPEARKYEGAI